MANLESKYYKHISCEGGVNECINIVNCKVIPNCVGYAWGRTYEVNMKRPNLSLGNAKNWFDFNDGYERSSIPKRGSIACFEGGQYGHVAYVEEVKSNGDIKISDSVYGGYSFKESILKKSDGYKYFAGYSLLGFIHTLPSETKYKSNKSYDLCVDIGLIGKTKVETIGYFEEDARRLYLQANSYEHKYSFLVEPGDEVVLTSYIGIATSNGKDIRVPAYIPKHNRFGFITLNFRGGQGTDFVAKKYRDIKNELI